MARNAHEPATARLGPQGRLVLPADLRRAMALEEGAVFSIRRDGGSLVLEPRDETIRRLKGRFAAAPASLTDELIADRRSEAGREG